ncbi:MAG: bifunctional diaminohydroxyphosphoribosylaminopyrimidine deaminase/5-amino-6-(5-phosphoribosylamino)uracil reductase RibD [candidate division KSB1 bacterium]|nr:bifunctional diaminohydroxyphosphoribosylaminopyrimidine deaminase/5-amino-6-(5-phosphoribosylamino)uracil reductase RibD [candidate division KSB1 bacterium]
MSPTKSISDFDAAMMRRALRLAEKGRGAVSPNPMVGAVIVKEGRIIGEGWHEQYGKAHAEVNAIHRSVGDLRGATMYVTLEPCNHTGKTGPCTMAILESGISEVVVALRDPNPLVNGQGINFLRTKGITVREGVLEEEARALNKGYCKHVKTGLPYVLLKMAQTLDGRIAASSGQSKWVTGEDARLAARKLRAQNDAILVGINTILADDPHLTVSPAKGTPPLRVILDSKLRIPLDANVVSDEMPHKTLIFTTEQASKEKVARITERGVLVKILEADERGLIPIPAILRTLGQMGVTSIMIEGGSRVHTECLRSGCADEIVIFIAPKILGEGVNAIGDLGIRNVNAALELEIMSIRRLEKDFMVTALFKPNPYGS